MKSKNNDDGKNRDKNKDKDKLKKKKINPEAAKELDSILKNALSNYLTSQASAHQTRTKDIESLKAVIEEFLNCYIIIGYLPNGEALNVISAHNQQEADSLSALLNKFLFNQQSGEDRDMPF
jgi:hypothetical protein